MSTGFSIHPGVFTPGEVSAVAEDLESRILDRTRAGARHLLGLPPVLALASDLDDSTHDNGPLRVIPGSHLEGVLSDSQVSARAMRGPVATCVVARGGVIAMRPLIIHASSKANAPQLRRVLHIEYARSLDLGDGIRLRAA